MLTKLFFTVVCVFLFFILLRKKQSNNPPNIPNIPPQNLANNEPPLLELTNYANNENDVRNGFMKDEALGNAYSTNGKNNY